MSYQVLARKWRPRDFGQMVGQEHVVRALGNALDSERVHHAYLFTGTRGVGKTTLGRIIAKCLNCERGVSSTPCGECGACTEIDEGRFVDLVEVDAASRSKVDETRDLMDNVQYAPARGRFKVYLIDEVHMFSEKSFNALLKTLEEPPPHVKFVLATTDPQKLPVTVLSRCLQFNLRQLPRAQIAAHLGHILEAEEIESEAAALDVIAGGARGSMRDALSLLDQAIAHGGGRIVESEVRAMLGTLDDRHVEALVAALAAGDPAELVARVDEMAAQSADFEDALAALVGALQAVAVVQIVGDAAPGAERWKDVAAAVAPEDVQLWYQIALLGRRDLGWCPEPRGGFEMTLLRMLTLKPFLDDGADRREAPGREPPSRRRARAVPAIETTPVAEATPAVQATPAVEVTPAPAADASTTSAEAERSTAPGEVERLLARREWGAAVDALGLTGLGRELASNCELVEVGDAAVRLRLAPGHRQLAAERVREGVEARLSDALGRRIRLAVDIAETEGDTPARERERARAARHAEAVDTVRGDPGVQAVCDMFGATVDDRRVRVRDSGDG